MQAEVVRPWQSSGKAKAPDSGGQQEAGWELQVTQVPVGSCQDGPSQALWGPEGSLFLALPFLARGLGQPWVKLKRQKAVPEGKA